MRIERTRNLTAEQKEIITRLWNAEYPNQLEYDGVADFEEFLGKIAEHRHFLLFDENENIGGWLVSFTRENERWFSIIVDGSRQKKGFGTAILNEVKKLESDLNGWVVAHDEYFKTSGEKYLSPIGFYKKNGFRVLSDVRLEKEDFFAVKIKWTK
jgi:GNAT superfamily N-acetyltransferase